MGKRFYLHLSLVIILFFIPGKGMAAGQQQVKISVFNFRTVNLEASGYGTTVTNMLMDSLKGEPALAILERKELESFLSLNDLQQDDNIDNVVNIGTRLGLNVIVVGSVEKKGSVITINCKVIQIEQRGPIFNAQIRTLGDAVLVNEIRKLSTEITTAIANRAAEAAEKKPVMKGPVNLQKRSGSKKVYLSWEDPPNTVSAGYEIYRSVTESGPYNRIAQTSRSECLDQDVERNTAYYYKVRSFNGTGTRSEFSDIISAETALTPNPPVILRAEGHIKSIELTWSPNPMSSEDPLKLKGYKVYRAKTEPGPYAEVAHILGKDLGIAVDATTTLDKLFKVTYVDRGLADGEEYYYQITAYNEKSMESDYSRPLAATTVPVVGGLSAKGDMIREVRLTWNRIASPSVKGYCVFRSTAESGDFARIKKIDASAAEGSKVLYLEKEGLGDKIRYYYRVTAFDSTDAETSPSAVVSAVTKGKPSSPSGFLATSGLVKKVDLRWTASPDQDVEGYNLYWSPQKDGPYELLMRIEGRTTTMFTDDSRGGEKLADNTQYFYSIRSFNKIGLESDPSEVVAAATKPRPAKPRGLAAQAFKVREVPLSWTSNPEADVDMYHIYRNADDVEPLGRVTRIIVTGKSSAEFTKIGTVQGKTAYVDKGLKDGYAYRYRLQAEDGNGLLSDLSEPVSVQTKSRPNSPKGVAGEFLKGTVELRWEPIAGADIAYYTVYEKRLFGLVKIETVKETRFRSEGPAKGKSKTYVVTATDQDGLESDVSREVTGVGK